MITKAENTCLDEQTAVSVNHPSKTIRELIIDPELKNLLPPLNAEQYATLEKDILENGCRTQLIAWDNVLVAGHHRYEICMKHQIPFDVYDLKFNSRDKAKHWIQEHHQREPAFFPIQLLSFDPDLRIREQINMETVSLYAEQMTTEDEMKKFPPVKIYYDGVKYWLGDGHHRRASSEKAGHDKVWAVVKKGTRADALWEAVLGNSKQGFGLTRADRKRAIALAIRQCPEKSNRMIADAVGCDEKTVRLYRESTAENSAVENQRRVGKDGKSRPAKQKVASQKVDKKVEYADDEVKNEFSGGEANPLPGPNVEIQACIPESQPTTEQPPKTISVSLKSSQKAKDTYCCGVEFEPDPDDDYYDWITREEREELRERQKTCPNKLVPQIRSYTIQSIPEHDPQYLISCLFSLFKPPYREKLAFALLRKMNETEADRESAIKVVTTIFQEFQNQ